MSIAAITVPVHPALELPCLFRLLGRGAIGTRELMGARVEAEADLVAIFALWSRAIDESALAAAEGGVVLVSSIAYPAFGSRSWLLASRLASRLPRPSSAA